MSSESPLRPPWLVFGPRMDFPGNLTTNLSLGTKDPRPSALRLTAPGVFVLSLLGCLVAAAFAWNALVLLTIAHVRAFHRRCTTWGAPWPPRTRWWPYWSCH